jgi:hypothetical protein
MLTVHCFTAHSVSVTFSTTVCKLHCDGQRQKERSCLSEGRGGGIIKSRVGSGISSHRSRIFRDFSIYWSSSSMALRPVFGPWPPQPSSTSEASVEVSRQSLSFIGWGCQPHAQPPTWRTRVSLFTWVVTFDLSDRSIDHAIYYHSCNMAFMCKITY